MAKRRKRRVRLGSSASEHRSELNRYMAQVQSQIQSMERRPSSCHATFLALTSLEHTLGKAAAHNASKGELIKPRFASKRSNRRYEISRRLLDRVEALETKFENECLKG